MSLAAEFAKIMAPIRDQLEAEALGPDAVKRIECVTAQAIAQLVQMDRREQAKKKKRSLTDRMLDELKEVFA